MGGAAGPGRTGRGWVCYAGQAWRIHGCQGLDLKQLLHMVCWLRQPSPAPCLLVPAITRSAIQEKHARVVVVAAAAVVVVDGGRFVSVTRVQAHVHACVANGCILVLTHARMGKRCSCARQGQGADPAHTTHRCRCCLHRAAAATPLHTQACANTSREAASGPRLASRHCCNPAVTRSAFAAGARDFCQPW